MYKLTIYFIDTFLDNLNLSRMFTCLFYVYVCFGYLGSPCSLQNIASSETKMYVVWSKSRASRVIVVMAKPANIFVDQ